ncbi:hypothetical protein M758_10G075100 [Ceratodon purpureus]|nr:hypothetical protein M758_10G075100 [Ceratodon purpureus]
MRQSTSSMKLAWLSLGLAIQLHFVVGSGPESLPGLPVYAFSMSNCSQFRNEMVLRPKFGVWPEDIKGVPFQYCCEYQPNGALSTFELSKYAYGSEGGVLQPAPYFDLGIVDNERLQYYWKNWRYNSLPEKQVNSVRTLYCDVTDLRRLYNYRFWNKSIVKGATAWAVVIAPLVLLVSILVLLGSKFNMGTYKTRKDTKRRSLDKEEAFADACHILLLALVGSSLMEGIAHAPLRTWRSQLMYKGGVTYVYLTLGALISTFIRHCVALDLRIWRLGKGQEASWLWQKVFLQFVALFMVGTYLELVEDVTEHSLDAVSSLALGTCTAASVWSAGVELVVLVRFSYLKIIRHNLRMDRSNSAVHAHSDFP